MSEWRDIKIREFYDVPRAVIARCRGELYLFDSRFDDQVDDYLDHYEVWHLPDLSQEDLAGSWESFPSLAIQRLADVGLRELPFVIPYGRELDAGAAKAK